MNIIHYDLFAGIGGFSLALEEVFNEAKINHIFYEWEHFPSAVLKKHWPNGIFYGDIAVTCAVELGATKTKRSLYSQADSPASRSATQDEEKARQITATSGRTCFESYKMSNQTGSSLKMCVGLLLGTTAWYSSRCALTWKAKVTKSNRLLFQLSPSTPRTAGTGSGLLPTVQTQGLKVCVNGKSIPMMLPTPDASDGSRGPAKIYNPRAKSQSGRTVTTLVGSGTGEKLRLQPAMPEWMMGFPEKWTEFPTASPNGETNRSKPTATP